jgi:hypothetical protein
VIDQWQYEELVKVLRQVKVVLVAGKLSDADKKSMLVACAESVGAAVAGCLAEYGPRCRIAIIPKGPYILSQIEELYNAK